MLSILFPLVQKQDLVFQFILKNSVTLILSIVIFLLIYKKQFKYSLRIFIFFMLVYIFVWGWIIYKNFANYNFAWYKLGAIWLGLYGISTLFLIIYVPLFLIELLYFIHDLIYRRVFLWKEKPVVKSLFIMSVFLFVYFILSVVVYCI